MIPSLMPDGELPSAEEDAEAFAKGAMLPVNVPVHKAGVENESAASVDIRNRLMEIYLSVANGATGSPDVPYRLPQG